MRFSIAASFLDISWAVAPIGLLVTRKTTKFIVGRAVAQGTIGRRNIVLLGDRTELEALEPRDLLAFFGAVEVNRFTLSADIDLLRQESDDIKILDLVADFIRKNNSAEILLALPWSATARIEFVRDKIKTLPVSAKLLPDEQIRKLTNYASSGYQRITSLEIQRAPLSATERMVKRAIDLFASILALIFFTPIMAADGACCS